MVEANLIKADLSSAIQEHSKKNGGMAVIPRTVAAVMDRTFLAADKVMTAYTSRTSLIGEGVGTFLTISSVLPSYERLLNYLSPADPEFFYTTQLPAIVAATAISGLVIGGILGKRFGLY